MSVRYTDGSICLDVTSPNFGKLAQHSRLIKTERIANAPNHFGLEGIPAVATFADGKNPVTDVKMVVLRGISFEEQYAKKLPAFAGSAAEYRLLCNL